MTTTNLATAFNNRGKAYGHKGDYDRAIEDDDQAIRLDPQKALAFRNRGLAYNSKGDYDRAIQDFDQVIRLNARNAGTFFNRGLAYESKGDYDQGDSDSRENYWTRSVVHWAKVKNYVAPLAGGFNQFASRSKVVVLREGVEQNRRPFNYSKAMAGSEEENFYVQPNDIVVVP